MESPEFEDKFRRVMALKNSFFHCTSVMNLLSILENGMYPYDYCISHGFLELDQPYPNQSVWGEHTDVLSFTGIKGANIIRLRGGYLKKTRHSLLIDDKHREHMHKDRQWFCYFYDGPMPIPSEDILAVVQESEPLPSSDGTIGPAVELMESQRKKLPPQKWTPLFYYKEFGESRLKLYVPRWLTISDGTTQQVRDYNPE